MRDLAFALAGLGLFLTGLHQLAQHLQLLAGPAVRMILARMASGPVSAAGSGLLLGALTQSTSAAAFVCIGLLNAGSLSFASALTLSAWASVGTAVLVFLASIDVLLLGLYGLGAIGLALLFNLNRYQIGQRVIGLGFALGILLAGLGLIKQGGALLEQSEWALEFFIFAGETAVIAFLVGVIVTLIVQSSATV
ncbi:MAG: Na/Pi symporter, partial [Gammaproteobacteria bacterium]